MMFQKRVVSVLLILALALPVLTAAPLAGAQGDEYFPAAEWRTSTPEEQGLDSAQLLAAVGLDGVNRVTETARGPVAVTGQWAARGFTMTLQFVGVGEERQLSYGGLGNRVMFIVQDASMVADAPPPTSNAIPRE